VKVLLYKSDVENYRPDPGGRPRKEAGKAAKRRRQIKPRKGRSEY